MKKMKKNNLNKLLEIQNLKMHIDTYDGKVKAVDGVNLDILSL